MQLPIRLSIDPVVPVGISMRSWIAFILVVIASLWLAVESVAFSHTPVPWTLPIPVVIAAFPLAVRRFWARIIAAFLLTIWTWIGMVALVYYFPGWVAAIIAAAEHDTRRLDAPPRGEGRGA